MESRKKISILVQIAILFLAGLILIGALSNIILYRISVRYVRDTLESYADSTAEDLKGYILHYPAYEWLLRYWYEHYDELEIEYDTIHTGGTETKEKCAALTGRHPEFQPQYASEEEAEALPPEDQKLYAEIVYFWIIDRIDHMQSAYDLDYLFCVVTEDPYDRQFVLFIAASEGEARGNEPGQIYPIGKTIKVAAEPQNAMRQAASGQPMEAQSRDKKYYDYFYPLISLDGHDLLIVQTLNVQRIREAVTTRLFDFGFLVAVLIIALAAGCLLTIHFVALRPLKKVQTNIRLYKETKDSRTAMSNLSAIRSSNEIAELSADVSSMAEALDEHMARNERITAEKERVKTELNFAKRIQFAMLPSVFPPYPDRKEFEIYASMTPAREVGGDFYDFFFVDDSHLCMVIADVSGKGIPAALYMMAAKITLAFYIKSGRTPAKVLTDANNTICASNPERMFVTVWLGILDLNTGILTAANAGHEYPIVKEPGKPFQKIKDEHGFVLGGIEDIRYKDYQIRMEPGTSLFLFTDGLAEAMDPDDNMFGTDRILRELNERNGNGPEEIIRGMKEAVDGFVRGREPFDDLTMLCITYRGLEQKQPDA